MADSMLVNTILMLVYVTKFFWWDAGYRNTMDIAHDRGSYISSLSFSFQVLVFSSIILFSEEKKYIHVKVKFRNTVNLCIP